MAERSALQLTRLHPALNRIVTVEQAPAAVNVTAGTSPALRGPRA